MDIVIAVIIGLLIGILIGILVVNRKLHKQSNGILMFDRSEPKLAPYLCFESIDDLTEIQKKKYVTLTVGWSKN